MLLRGFSIGLLIAGSSILRASLKEKRDMNKLTTNDLTVQQQNAYLAVMYSLIATNDIVYNLTVDFLNSIPKGLMKKEMKYRINLMKADAKKWWQRFKGLLKNDDGTSIEVIDEIEDKLNLSIFQFYNACLFRLQKSGNDFAVQIAKGEVARVMAVTARNFVSDAVEKFGMTALRHISSSRLYLSVNKVQELVIANSNQHYTSFNENDAGQNYSSIANAYREIMKNIGDFEGILAVIRRKDRENDG